MPDPLTTLRERGELPDEFWPRYQRIGGFSGNPAMLRDIRNVQSALATRLLEVLDARDHQVRCYQDMEEAKRVLSVERDGLKAALEHANKLAILDCEVRRGLGAELADVKQTCAEQSALYHRALEASRARAGDGEVGG
ncbi:MAG: hypothetical protein ACLQUT_05340 [Thermoleophilia bacterium]